MDPKPGESWLRREGATHLFEGKFLTEDFLLPRTRSRGLSNYLCSVHMEKQVQRGEGADARSPRSSQEQAVLEAPNQEIFSGETAALRARGRRGGGVVGPK